MTSHDGSRFKKSQLDPRQLKTFIRMYQDPQYSLGDIEERFGLSASTVLQIARENNLTMRKAK